MSMGGWRYVAASVIGTSHDKAGGACQDANDCQIYALPAGEKVLAAAVGLGALFAAVQVRQEHVARCSASWMNTWIQAGPSNKSPKTRSGLG